MSCDTSIYHTTVDLDPCLSPRLDLGDCAPASETGLERDKSLKRGRAGPTADQSNQKNIGMKFNCASFLTPRKRNLNTCGVTKGRSMTDQVRKRPVIFSENFRELRPESFPV